MVGSVSLILVRLSYLWEKRNIVCLDKTSQAAVFDVVRKISAFCVTTYGSFVSAFVHVLCGYIPSQWETTWSSHGLSPVLPNYYSNLLRFMNHKTPTVLLLGCTSMFHQLAQHFSLLSIRTIRYRKNNTSLSKRWWWHPWHHPPVSFPCRWLVFPYPVGRSQEKYL